MLKEYFVDGLVQIAIVLSLLRTEPGNVLRHTVNESHFHEVHEIILGGTSAYTRSSDFHNRWRSPIGIDVHPKHIENYVSPYSIQELCSLPGWQLLPPVYRDIEAYLVSEEEDSHDSPNLDSNEADLHDNNTHSINSNSETLTTNSVSTSDNSSASGELTPEDMDLIEILWRQDMDLGVTKDAFNNTLKQELEREDQRQSLKIESSSQQLVNSQTTLVGDDGNFTSGVANQTAALSVDDETGEMVPSQFLPVNNVSTAYYQQQTNQLDPVTAPFSFEDAMEILEGALSATAAPESFYNSSSLESSVQWNASSEVVDLLRQNSLEARWQDLTAILSSSDLVDNNTSPSYTFNTSIDSSFTESPLSVLLRNASLTGYSEISENLTNAATFSPSVRINSTEPSIPISSTGQWPLEGLFPDVNLTGLPNNTDLFLQEVLQAGQTTLNLTDLGLSGSEVEDSHSDSAFGSMRGTPHSFHLEDENHFLDPPFDGVEGATGGSEPLYSKDFLYTLGASFDRQRHTSYGNFSSDNSSEHFPGSYTTMLAEAADINHNHTYTAQPEPKPQEYHKKKSKTKIKEQPGLLMPRDEKKLQALAIPFTMEQIVNSPVDSFNDLLTKYRFSEAQLQLIKDVRRRGKNKVAAQNCRKRKIEVIVSLDDEVSELRRRRDALRAEQNSLQQEQQSIQKSYHELYRKVMEGQLDDNGVPYSQNYRLQHLQDGSVVLVPKEAMDSNDTIDSTDETEKKKRKSASRK